MGFPGDKDASLQVSSNVRHVTFDDNPEILLHEVDGWNNTVPLRQSRSVWTVTPQIDELFSESVWYNLTNDVGKASIFSFYSPLKLLVKKLDSSAFLPSKGTADSAGFDLCSHEDKLLNPGQHLLLDTAVSCAFPPGHYGRIAPRSGLALKHGIFVNAGVIDPDYRGSMKVLLVNHGTHALRITQGMRIAQLILERYADAVVHEVTTLPDTARSSSGFGSTGTHQIDDSRPAVNNLSLTASSEEVGKSCSTAEGSCTTVLQRPSWMLSAEDISKIGKPPQLDIPEDEKWSFWEWLAGSAVLTGNMKHNDVVCGPPVDYNTGWNLYRKDHQQALLALLSQHEPQVLWIAMPHLSGRTFTAKENSLMEFLRQVVEKQMYKGRQAFVEGITSLPVWRNKSVLGLKIHNTLHSTLYDWCGLQIKDPETSMNYLRKSEMFGTSALTSFQSCSCRCDKDAKHQSLRSNFSNGMERSKVMQQYPTELLHLITTDVFQLLKLKKPPITLSAPNVSTPTKHKQIRENPNLPVFVSQVPESNNTDEILISEKATAEKSRKPHRSQSPVSDERLDMHPHEETLDK